MVALNVWPTDGADGSVATEAKWRKMGRHFAPTGVLAGVGGELKPTLAGTNLTIADGACWIDGHFAELTGSQVLTVTANGIAVVRFDPAANSADLVYRDAATVPAQDPAGVYEMLVAGITGSALIDRRVLVGPAATIGFEVYNPAPQLCGAGAWVPLGYTDANEIRDVGGWHQQVPNSSRFYVPVTGSYLITGSVNWVSGAAATSRVCGFMMDGLNTTIIGVTTSQPNTGVYQAFSQLMTLTAGHYIEHVLWNGAGAGVNVQGWRFAATLLDH